jgi:acyl-coenzyme A synthetase/AMP-(fatty) acid ligase
VATDDELAQEIRAFVGQRLAHYQAPREIAFVPELPLTATGKIMRRELRALNIHHGDTAFTEK